MESSSEAIKKDQRGPQYSNWCPHKERVVQAGAWEGRHMKEAKAGGMHPQASGPQELGEKGKIHPQRFQREHGLAHPLTSEAGPQNHARINSCGFKPPICVVFCSQGQGTVRHWVGAREPRQGSPTKGHGGPGQGDRGWGSAQTQWQRLYHREGEKSCGHVAVRHVQPALPPGRLRRRVPPYPCRELGAGLTPASLSRPQAFNSYRN